MVEAGFETWESKDNLLYKTTQRILIFFDKETVVPATFIVIMSGSDLEL